MNIQKKPDSFYSKQNTLSIIKDDIRNYRNLNETQLFYIQISTTHNEKIEIIELFNECLSVMCTALLKDEN